MIPYALLLLTLIVALCSLRLLRPARAAWHRTVLSLLLAGFVFLYGAWVFLSFFLKYAFAAVYLVILIRALLRSRQGAVPAAGRWRAGMNMALGGVFLLLSVLYFTGTTGGGYKVAQLHTPFLHGRYFVFQGGRGMPTNVFHAGRNGAVFAMDIIKLNANGSRASHIFSTRLTDYAIFLDTVYSPCDGVVMRSTDDNPDNIPPDRTRGPSNTNHVLIDAGDKYVFLGHFSYRKVLVRAGDRVTAGQPLALAGNSGFSIEPHLHIQVHEHTGTGLEWYRERPMQIAFEGRTYLLFEVICAGRQ